MKILLLGKNGQLGWELQRTLAPLGSITPLDYEDLNLENVDEVRSTIRKLKPQVIVNASAYTAVDKAETEPEKAYAINATIPGVLAEEAKALDSILIHFSTDYVFDGRKGSTYTEKDTPNPLNIYGKSKLAGEKAIEAVSAKALTLRTSWVYSLRKGGFVNKVLEWSRSQETMRIVSDQVANPTWARMLAQVTSLLLGRGGAYIAERAGLYHLAGNGYTSRYDWTKQILALDPARHEQRVRNLLPALSTDFPTPAERPLFSALDNSKFDEDFGVKLTGWELALAQAMDY